MVTSRSPHLLFTLALLLAVPAGASLPYGNERAQGQGRETFTAFAVSTGGQRSNAVAEQLTFAVERWSTDAERQALADVLTERGPDALLDKLRAMPEVGYLRTPDSLGYPLRYADQQPLPEGGRRIVFATDRPISFSETWNSSRTLDYPFTVVELRMDGQGEGEGKLSLATRVIQAGERVLLENWDTVPVQLTNVRATR
jgi:hypothetical protein